MNTIENFKEYFEQIQQKANGSGLKNLRQQAFSAFNKMGIPTVKHEEWKYTRLSSVFNKDYQFPFHQEKISVEKADLDQVRLPGYENANELVFVNGVFTPSLSTLRSEHLVVLPLEEAARSEYRETVTRHLGHSADYLKDGINALNTALVNGGVFIYVKKGKILQQPVYIYHISDTRSGNTFAQPRSLVHIDEGAQAQFIETSVSLGQQESFTSLVMEMVVEKDALVEHYKIQNDNSRASQVSTTHIRQTGKSFTNSVTISLNGGIVRNNLNVIMEASHCESHLYGLYFQKGDSHIDNHTIVDNVEPNCESTELYKGILDDQSTGVFNGKIFVRPLAQKTNAYQSNKNVLLSDTASVNTKPQLEIFADDVKCSHGCTVGQLDQEGMFYLRSRGIPKKTARALLLQGFVVDILDKIKLQPIRDHVHHLVSERLELI